MKLGPVTKPDKRNTATSKKLDDGVMSTNCDVTVLLPIYSQFGAILKEDSGRTVCNIYIFTIVLFHLPKTENRTKKTHSSYHSSYIALTT